MQFYLVFNYNDDIKFLYICNSDYEDNSDYFGCDFGYQTWEIVIKKIREDIGE